MKKAELDDEISHWEGKLKHIDWEYNNSMTKDWPKIREKQLFFIREIARLKRLKEKSVGNSSVIVTGNIKPLETTEYDKVDQNHQVKTICEEEQWDINNKLLIESYEEEEELAKNMLLEDENNDNAEQYSYFINSLDDEGLHNLDNAMEAMDIDVKNKRKREGYAGEPSFTREERERPTRKAGNWPPEKDSYQPTYIPGQYHHSWCQEH